MAYKHLIISIPKLPRINPHMDEKNELRDKIAIIINGGYIPPEGKCFEYFDSHAEWQRSINGLYARADKIIELIYHPLGSSK